MSKNNSKSLSSLRQKFRKYAKDFENDLAKFRESPDEDDDEEEEKPEEPSESSEDEAPAKAVSFKKDVVEKEKKVPKYQEDSDDSIDWGSDSDSDSDSSDDDAASVNIRERFLKNRGAADKEDKDDDGERKKKKLAKEGKLRKRREEDDDEGEWETVTKGSATSAEKPKMFAKDAEINIRLVLDKLNEVSAGFPLSTTCRICFFFIKLVFLFFYSSIFVFRLWHLVVRSVPIVVNKSNYCSN